MSSPPAPRPHAYALARLRANPWLQASMAMALFCYGGACVLVVWQHEGASRLDFATAGTVVAMSLGSWSLLFWWFPILARTVRVLEGPRTSEASEGEARGPAGIARALEIVATACVVSVHVMLLLIILHEAGL